MYLQKLNPIEMGISSKLGDFEKQFNVSEIEHVEESNDQSVTLNSTYLNRYTKFV